MEPNIIRSNSIKALLQGLTEERLELFSVLAKEKPNNLTQLANYHRYNDFFNRNDIFVKWSKLFIYASSN